MTTYLTLILALIAFAANSVLCRLALASGAIDPSGFTSLRLASGAIVLALILLVRNSRRANSITSKGSWLGALMLFAYALGFSYAYVQLDTGTGALILFGSVQLSMIAFALFKGERFGMVQLLGLCSAFLGLIYLMLPSISTPSIVGALGMIIAGLAWGVYSIIGKSSRDALSDTAFNFLRALLFVIPLVALTLSQIHSTFYGIVLAILSGALASGIGYALWYQVLPALSSVNAAVSQLSVPVIAALGGVLFVSELISLRLLIASILVLGGILLVVLNKSNAKPVKG